MSFFLGVRTMRFLCAILSLGLVAYFTYQSGWPGLLFSLLGVAAAWILFVLFIGVIMGSGEYMGYEVLNTCLAVVVVLAIVTRLVGPWFAEQDAKRALRETRLLSHLASEDSAVQAAGLTYLDSQPAWQLQGDTAVGAALLRILRQGNPVVCSRAVQLLARAKSAELEKTAVIRPLLNRVLSFSDTRRESSEAWKEPTQQVWDALGWHESAMPAVESVIAEFLAEAVQRPRLLELARRTDFPPLWEPLLGNALARSIWTQRDVRAVTDFVRFGSSSISATARLFLTRESTLVPNPNQVVDTLVLETALLAEAGQISASETERHKQGGDALVLLGRQTVARLPTALRLARREDRWKVVLLACQLGIPGSEEALVSALHRHGDRLLAEDYLNSGSRVLAGAGRDWLTRRGYEIKEGPGSHRFNWRAE
jgi:AcrR family transcriptional regulator